ncbi:Disease resistance protein (CC-NBS-LRR class) family [Rhynchospora pubera]|uniref:Disease resistance protein (CC-NBS-LRR class) family n=1 Tax=Rhynchospora pubera TaxID=906938 RepID=A0AAV8G5W5_9POAL|nr:Disease resistance protein (CC-NBS-LRR class) family [Rhynchospora pubera]
MAMIADAFVGLFIDRLSDFAKDRGAMLFGIEEEVSRLQEKTRGIQIFLTDAEKRRIKESAINHWLQELKEALYDAEDIVDLCQIEALNLLQGQESTSRTPSVLSWSWIKSALFRHRISSQIRNLNCRMDAICSSNLTQNLERISKTERQITSVDRRHTSSLSDPDVVGKEIRDATEKLMEVILDDKRQKIGILSIVGMGGIGKTTIAQNLYNDPRILTNFKERVWVCVSQNYSEIDLLKGIIRGIMGDHTKSKSVGELKSMLADAVREKTFFLVLDDVWRPDVWTNLLRIPLQSAANAQVLITTRDRSIALSMGAVFIHQAESLSVDSGWELLCKSTYLDTDHEVQDLKDLGIQIVAKCGGLPLAIRAISGLLTTKERNRREWERVLRSAAWSMDGLPEDLRGALYLSYEDLPRHLKQCFLYCSLYPEDYTIKREDLIRYWVAEGLIEESKDQLMEDTAEEYYNELIRRSLLQPDPRRIDQVRCTMHDLLRSLGRYLSSGECFYGDPQLLDLETISKVQRMSVQPKDDMVVMPGGENQFLKLRSFLLFKTPPTIETGLLRRLPYLRVLRLNGSDLYTVPDSLGSLIHLRLLDLEQTSISSLPETIGSLRNLQILNLNYCKFLKVLPRGLTRLCNLRRIGIRESPIAHFPQGIEKLNLLNDMSGFVVCTSNKTDGWNLQELESLSFLRRLDINKLERAVPQVNDEYPSVLETKSHLRFLQLSCTPQAKGSGKSQYTEKDVSNIETIYEELSPPPSLDRLVIWEYFGTRYPKWLNTSLPRLTSVHLQNCVSCPALPPLGQLPYLKFLKIVGASSIKSIGSEFLGNNRSVAFPKLEVLHMQQMPKLEDWVLDESVKGLVVFPRLTQLNIVDCRKLRSLPEKLNDATGLKQVYIKGSHMMNVIENILSLSNQLQIKSCSSLKRISNVPHLRDLSISDCPALRRVDGLDQLQCLQLSDELMKQVPSWVSGFVKRRKYLQFDYYIEFSLLCNAHVMERCRRGGPDWPVIELFSRVRASTGDNKTVLEYTRMPFSYNANF